MLGSWRTYIRSNKERRLPNTKIDLEPRLVETGRRIGDEVEVTKGLVAGERIVISGTFLIDSESRMKTGAKP